MKEIIRMRAYLKISNAESIEWIIKRLIRILLLVGKEGQSKRIEGRI
jgi:hypothetical protein